MADSPSRVDKDNNTQPSEKLYAESDVNIQDASNLTEVFSAKYNLSDNCSKSLYALVDVLLPEENKLPSGYSHIQKMKKNFDDRIRLLPKTSDYSLCVLNFRFQLRDIVNRNFSQIIEYAKLREKFPNSDFKHSLCPPVTKQLYKRLVFNLILFSDGVNIKKSTHKKEPWPVWVQLADLPPKMRMARNNIVLAALHVGANYPDWNKLVPLIQAEVISSIEIEISDDLKYQSLFKFRLLIADLGAKNHMLNMLKFNGYYGCHYCTVEGKTIGRTHAYYPHDGKESLREPHLNDLYVSIAEAISTTKNLNVVGVRGRSAFASLIEGLPLTAPIDYMHCVLLGVFPDLLKLCYKALSCKEREKVNLITANLCCPREMVSFSRKVRSLEELSQFKANELFNWLFYVSPVLFLDRNPPELYSHLTNLVFGIRLLLESSCNKNVAASSLLFENFCREIILRHDGNGKIETINVHCLTHLCDQVTRFGPLFCQSAMSFESANRTRGEVFTGAHSECEIFCRRILQRHKFLDVKLRMKN